MFSGIVEEMGVVRSLTRNAVTRNAAGARLSLTASAVRGDLRPGDSISVSGVCLTVAGVDEAGFSADVSPETLAVTTLGDLTPGAAVNLERALRLNDRLGGHLVTGHVDGTGMVCERAQQDNAVILTVDTPDAVRPYCVRKGALAVDGVSLTINAVSASRVCVAVIPHTAAVTTLGTVRVGHAVNLESDLIGKYVERLLAAGEFPTRPPVTDRDNPRQHGLP